MRTADQKELDKYRKALQQTTSEKTGSGFSVHVKSKKLQDHLAALESRCHYIDLQMDTEREKVLRIRQIVGDGMLDSYKFNDGEEQEVMDFIDDQKKKLRELSLRTVLKIADLRKSFPGNWKSMAEVTVMKTG